MLKQIIPWVLFCTAVVSAVSQTSSKYQPATIVAVASHPSTPGEPDVIRYDVSIKVGNMLYGVLYTPPSGAKLVEYYPGFDLLVLVESDTLTFNSRLSGTTAVPILSRQALAKEGIDWSKMPGQYFSMKQEHLTETLNLNDDQQARLRPILEQETAEVGQFLGNPVLSRKDKVKRWEKVVRASDEKLKPYLSPGQLQELESLRATQKEELKRIIERSGDQK